MHEADAYVLQHDKALAKEPQRQRHLRQMPDYLKEATGLKKGTTRHSSIRAPTLKRKLRAEDDPLKVISDFVLEIKLIVFWIL